MVFTRAMGSTFLTYTLWSALVWAVRVPYVAQVMEKLVMVGGGTRWVDM